MVKILAIRPLKSIWCTSFRSGYAVSTQTITSMTCRDYGDTVLFAQSIRRCWQLLEKFPTTTESTSPRRCSSYLSAVCMVAWSKGISLSKESQKLKNVPPNVCETSHTVPCRTVCRTVQRTRSVKGQVKTETLRWNCKPLLPLIFSEKFPLKTRWSNDLACRYVCKSNNGQKT